MQCIKRSLAAVAVFAVSLAAAAAALFFLTADSALAAELGTEAPEVYCTYRDQSGNEADGNSLSAGTYDVSFYISGVETVSTLQLTASYDSSVTVDSTPVALMSDDAANAVSSMGEILTDGRIVFGFVSNNDDGSAVNSGGALIATVKMTFAEPCDAETLITVAANPNLTFAQVSYADGFEDSYAVDTEFADYNGTLYPMVCDITPALAPDTFDISGQIKISTDVTGTDTTVGIVGINVSVIDKENGTTIAEAVTDENGYYTLTSVPAGEHKMLVSGPTTVDREVTLIVSETKNIDSVGIIICDYNKDGKINATDKGAFSGSFFGEFNVYTDFNGDVKTNATDKGVFAALFNRNVNYGSLTIV